METILAGLLFAGLLLFLLKASQSTLLKTLAVLILLIALIYFGSFVGMVEVQHTPGNPINYIAPGG